MTPAGGEQVTAVLYLLDERNVLATAGGTDGAIKLWDARLGGAGRGERGRRAAQPLSVLAPDSGRERPHGIISLSTDASGGRLAGRTRAVVRRRSLTRLAV